MMKKFKKSWNFKTYDKCSKFFLTKQELPFFSHDESNTSINRYNYLELLELIGQYDPILKNHLKESTVIPNQFSAIQNDLIF